MLKKNTITQIAIWVAYFMLMAWFYSDIRTYDWAFAKAGVLVAIHIVVFYLNLMVLQPRYLENRKYWIYGILVFLLVVVVLAIIQFIEHQLPTHDISDAMHRGMKERGRGPQWRPPREVRFSKQFMFKIFSRKLLFDGFFIALILFISSIYGNNILRKRREEEALELKTQALEAESKMLKWQINPHFLFNTLNNIYALSQLKSEKAPDAVLKLSEMLRYVIYDCNEEFVRLEQEVNYLKNYIELQLLKDDGIQNVEFDIQGMDNSVRIAPLLLIAFVENSFKHSKIEDNINGYIRIRIITGDDKLEFTIKNSIPEIPFTKDKSGGVGLQNVKRRLELLYRYKHQLEIIQTDTEYSVKLSIGL